MQTMLKEPVTSNPDHMLSAGNKRPDQSDADQRFEEAIREGREAADADRQDEIANEFVRQKEPELPQPDFANMADASRNTRDEALSKGLEQAGLGPQANPATPEQQAVGQAAVGQSLKSLDR